MIQERFTSIASPVHRSHTSNVSKEGRKCNNFIPKQWSPDQHGWCAIVKVVIIFTRIFFSTHRKSSQCAGSEPNYSSGWRNPFTHPLSPSITPSPLEKRYEQQPLLGCVRVYKTKTWLLECDCPPLRSPEHMFRIQNQSSSIVRTDHGHETQSESLRSKDGDEYARRENNW